MKRVLLLMILLAGCGSGEAPPGTPRRTPRAGVEARAQSYLGDSGRPQAAAPAAEVEVREETSQRGLVRFNGATREILLDVTLTGMEVVFDPAEDGHPLNEYDGAGNVATLRIRADALRIRAPLRLPGTDVVIHARRLIFEDPDPEEPGSIDLSPMEADYPTPAPRQPGEAGERGGNLTLYIGTLEGERRRIEDQSPERSGPEVYFLPVRFVSNGSKGGSGGPGVPGKDVAGGNRLAHKAGRAATAAEIRGWTRIITPKSGGKGGDGGDAGGFASTLPEAVDLARRSPGRPGPTHSAKGGQVVYYNGKQIRRYTGYARDREYGKPGTVPGARTIEGALGDPGAHPAVLRLMVNRVRDLYMAGYIAEAREICVAALSWTPRIAFPNDPDQELAFRVQRGELITLAERLASDLDYFGNPKGWVPRLSLEANYAVYAGEAEASVRMMFLSYWLEQVWAERDQRIEGLTFAIDQKNADVEEYRQTIRSIRKLLPALLREAQTMRGETERFLLDLRDVEARVTAKFESDEEWRRVLATIFDAIGDAATALTFITPWAAPVAGAFMIAGPLTREGPAKVSGGTAGDAFQKILDDEDVAEARRSLAELDPGSGESALRFETELASLSRDLEKATRKCLEQQMREALAGQVDDDFDAAMRLNQVMRRDADFKKVYDRLIAIVTKRQVFREKIAEALADLDDAIVGIQESIWAVDGMEAARRSAVLRIDSEARAVLSQMRRRARDRLVLYQYYLAKAYEYRMLTPCPVSPLANRVYAAAEKEFGTKVGADKPFDINSPRVKDLVEIYREDLREVVRATVTGMNNERFDPVIAKAEVYLNDGELRRLNETGAVAINLESLGAITPADRNARVAGVRVIEKASRFEVAERPSGDFSATLDLTVEPPERGVILWEDQAYSFFYGGSRAASVVLGGYTWREPSGTGEPMVRSKGADSLLSSMIDKTFGDRNRINRIHFRPSAHGEIVVRIGAASSPEGVRIRVTELALEVDIEKNKTSRR